MPKLSKPKRKTRFGEPPPQHADTKGNLSAPEVAPAPEQRTVSLHVDGRTLRVTGRTTQFATRVHPEWKLKLHQISQRTRLMYVEILERALEAFERELDNK